MAESALSNNAAIYVVEGELVDTEESEGEGRQLDDNDNNNNNNSRPRVVGGVGSSSPKIGGMIGNMLGEDEDHLDGNINDADNNQNNNLAAASSLSVEEPHSPPPTHAFLPMDDDPISLFDDDQNGGNYNDVNTNMASSSSTAAAGKKFDYAPIDDSNYESVNDDVPTNTHYGLSSPASATTTPTITSRGKRYRNFPFDFFPRDVIVGVVVAEAERTIRTMEDT